jgi:CubicO group peptidase (beta-lactamase class C family)
MAAKRTPLTAFSADWYAPPHVTSNGAFDSARSIVLGGLSDRAFPAATVSVGRSSGALWEEAFGRLTYDAGAARCTDDTIFDLASLTKVISTAGIAMRLVERRQLSLNAPVRDLLPDFDRPHWRTVQVRHLLDHSSGLPAHLRLWQTARGAHDYRQAVMSLPLERAPGEASVYSDPGFMLLGWVLDSVGGASLDRQFTDVLGPDIAPLLFEPGAELRDRIAPTEFDPWRGRLICGEVHDENAAALGGVAAHAGLFGTAPAVGAFARLVLQTFTAASRLGSPSTMRLFAARSAVPGSSRALGWDTALPTSSSGTRMRPTAIGHTGFTGTSLWIDWERDCYAVLLTNRVHPQRTNEKLLPLRARFHDALPF